MVNHNQPRFRLMLRAVAAIILCDSVVGPLVYAQTAAPPSYCDVEAKGPEVCAHQLYIQVSSQFLLDRDTKRATAGFKRVTQLVPGYAAAWFNLAVLAEQSHEWIMAKADFEHYLKFAPVGPDAKRAEQELQTLKPYVAGLVTPAKANRAEYDASISRARFLLNSQLYREAILEAAHAQTIDGSRWESYAVVCLVMGRQGKSEEATKFRDMAIARVPAAQKSKVAKALSGSSGN
jgi:tetratricopeptide (TPR) repeat protein